MLRNIVILKNTKNVSKKCHEKEHVDLLLILEEGKRLYILIKDFNTFMYENTLHRGRKHFCSYCLQAYSTEEILTCHIKGCLEINGKQRFRCLQKVNTLNSKILKGK